MLLRLFVYWDSYLAMSSEKEWRVSSSGRRNARGGQSEQEWRWISILVPPAMINSTTERTSANVRVLLRQALEKEWEYLKEASALARQMAKNYAEPIMYARPTDPRCPYRVHPRDVRPSVHAGQLKLCLSELWALTKANIREATGVMYAGAAEGHHIPFLANLWPECTFALWDPRPFHHSLKDVKNIQIHTGDQGMFTDATANAMAALVNRRYPLVFISDIRSGNPDDATCDFDKCVRDNMAAQRRWVEIMKPRWAMLKFCLSYKPGRTEYLAPEDDNSLSYGVFATKSGTELRLMVKGDNLKTRVYDNTEMEERSYYFNNFTRLCRYKLPGLNHERWGAIGVDSCWDCRCMMRICLDYFAQRVFHMPEGEVLEIAEVIAAVITQVRMMPKAMAMIIGQYVGLAEAQLYDFIRQMIITCGPATCEKMIIRPHADLEYDQWIDVMRNYDGIPIHSKGRTTDWKPISTMADTLMQKVYAELGPKAPALGHFAGRVTRAAGDRANGL